jgi:ABC-type branched-subunit amino acid transport system ATPase component
MLRVRTRLTPEPDLKAVRKSTPHSALARIALSDNMPLIEVRQLSKAFAGVQALQDVTMAVRQGSIHGLIGPNGAGKSTLVNVITGVYMPESGSITYRGEAITAQPAPRRAGLGIRRTFQNPQLPHAMTVLEAVLAGAHTNYQSNLLHISCALPRVKAEEQVHMAAAMDVIDQLDLTEIYDELTTSIPYSKQRMVELARALLGRPDLLILDEPAAGLSEAEMQDLGRILTRLKERGMTTLIIEHHMDFLLELVDDVTVLDFGRVIFRGDPVSLQHDQAVEEAYLGGVVLA